MEKNIKFDIPEITKSLSDISVIMADGYMVLKIRMALEKWEKEAKSGNADSQTLIDMVTNFERLVKVIVKDDFERKMNEPF